MPGRTEMRWTFGAVLLAALYAFFVLWLPTRGVPFLFDDWSLLKRFNDRGVTAWCEPVNQHWVPIFLGALHLEHRLFGGRNDLFLAVQSVLHVANVFLLARNLVARLGDERAAALGAIAFAFAPTYRVALWWATSLCVVLCFTAAALAFLAHERWLATKEPRWLALALASTFAAPLAWGGGLAVAPTLVLEALWRERRLRAGAPFLAVAVATAALYVAFNVENSSANLPRTSSDLRHAALFFAESYGHGFVHDLFLLPANRNVIAGVSVALLYAVAIAAVLVIVSRDAGRHILVGNAFVAGMFALMALSRWKLVATGLPIFDHSYYQYLPAFAWTVPFAAVVAALAARHGPRVYAVAALAIVVLGVAHGREAALDRTPFSPARRRELQHPEVVARIAEVVASTRGPVFDARVSRFLAWSEVRVHDVVAIAAPGVAGVYTTTLSAETFAPFERDPLLTHNVLPR